LLVGTVNVLLEYFFKYPEKGTRSRENNLVHHFQNLISLCKYAWYCWYYSSCIFIYNTNCYICKLEARAPIFDTGCEGGTTDIQNCILRPCNSTFTSVFDTFQCGIRSTKRHNNVPGLFLRIIGGKVLHSNKDWSLCLTNSFCLNDYNLFTANLKKTFSRNLEKISFSKMFLIRKTYTKITWLEVKMFS